jgi:hypothetical protein
MRKVNQGLCVAWQGFGFACRNSEVDPCTNINYGYAMVFTLPYETDMDQARSGVRDCLAPETHGGGLVGALVRR